MECAMAAWEQPNRSPGAPLATMRSASKKSPKPSSSSRLSALTQNTHVPAIRLQLGGKAEIIVPADEFEPSAELYQG